MGGESRDLETCEGEFSEEQGLSIVAAEVDDDEEGELLLLVTAVWGCRKGLKGGLFRG